MKNQRIDTIEDLLTRNINRELVMAIDDGLYAGAARAFNASSGIADGHKAHALGQLRHFHMNEAFHRALEANSGLPTPLKGNSVIQGKSGIFDIARFNVSQGIWNSAKRSKTRKQMSKANRSLLPLIQPDIFETYTTPSCGAIFFVSVFSGLNDAPNSIHIAVPDEHMESWLFREPIYTFLQRYEAPIVVQEDLAVPKLKRAVKDNRSK